MAQRETLNQLQLDVGHLRRKNNPLDLTDSKNLVAPDLARKGLIEVFDRIRSSDGPFSLVKYEISTDPGSPEPRSINPVVVRETLEELADEYDIDVDDEELDNMDAFGDYDPFHQLQDTNRAGVLFATLYENALSSAIVEPDKNTASLTDRGVLQVKHKSGYFAIYHHGESPKDEDMVLIVPGKIFSGMNILPKNVTYVYRFHPGELQHKQVSAYGIERIRTNEGKVRFERYRNSPRYAQSILAGLRDIIETDNTGFADEEQYLN